MRPRTAVASRMSWRRAASGVEQRAHSVKATQIQSYSATCLPRVQAAVEEVLAEILRRGFYGKGEIELSVQDGVIQQIRRRVEQFVQQ